MIKINLLESVTDRPTGSVAVVESRVANPRAQTLLLAFTVAGLLALGMGYDFYTARSARDTAQKELKRQQDINAQMLAVKNEQLELEQKTKDIQVRIDAILKLRTSQQGPGTVLREIKARFDSVPGLYLKSLAQKDSEVTIKGESPDEASVTRFGKTLEFSSGLFNNFNIETERQAAKVEGVTAPGDNVPQPEVVSFTIKCSFVPPPSAPKPTVPGSAQSYSAPANQIAQK
jgi:Tfp pilus assembly protein PilN